MQMNSGLILASQPLNALGAIQQGNQAAAQTNAIRDHNALRALYQSQGAGIANGDAGALNALAGLDPMAAMQAKQAQQSMAFDAEKMQMLRAEAAQKAQAYAASLTAAQREAEAKKIADGIAGAGYFFNKGDRAGYDAFLSQQGIDPATHPFDQFPALAAQYGGALDALKNFQTMSAPADPTDGAPSGFMWKDPQNRAAGVVPLPGAEKQQGPLTTEGKLKADLDAGRIDQAAYEAGMARLAPKGTSLSFDPATGQMTFNQGAGVGQSGTGTPTDLNPFNVESLTSEINAIMNDPALPKVTGPIEGGGGNDVEKLNLAQRVYYGSDGLALIEKVGKLQGTTWLAARQFLKGGGLITDYESRKAESAISRLSRVKDDKEFAAALSDLRDAVVEGAAKLKATKNAIPEVPQGIDGITPENWPAIWDAMPEEDRALFK